MREFIHCDIKPENVRLNSACDSAVLVDWGFARHIYKQHAFVTEGTPVYASPEQLTGYSADMAWGRLRLGPSADVWALGTSLYEMLVGRPPFSASPSGRWAAAREANAEASVESFDALVANVLRLNYEMPDELSLEVRQLIDAMLQVTRLQLYAVRVAHGTLASLVHVNILQVLAVFTCRMRRFNLPTVLQLASCVSIVGSPPWGQSPQTHQRA